jgi:CBS domain containing-hemolysin-like protein
MTDEPRRETPASESPRPATGLLDRLRGLFGIETGSVRDDIEDALEGDGDSVDFTPQERTILKNVLGLHDVRLADVMVPRADVIAIQIDAPLSEVLALFRAAGHSRFPVYGETLDDPRGMVHIRDFLDYLAGAPALGLAPGADGGSKVGAGGNNREQPFDMNLPLGRANILRPVLYAPPSMPALDLLVRMQASRTHMALVIDEYGGADGLVSMEDVVEAIVGDIEDEHDESETPSIEPTPDGAFIADAKASLEDVSKALGVDLSALADAEDAETIAGLITARAGRVPGRGEIIAGIGGYENGHAQASNPKRPRRLSQRIAAQPRSTARCASASVQPSAS